MWHSPHVASWTIQSADEDCAAPKQLEDITLCAATYTHCIVFCFCSCCHCCYSFGWWPTAVNNDDTCACSSDIRRKANEKRTKKNKQEQRTKEDWQWLWGKTTAAHWGKLQVFMLLFLHIVAWRSEHGGNFQPKRNCQTDFQERRKGQHQFGLNYGCHTSCSGGRKEKCYSFSSI